jgi:NADPH2:quinone reductase
MRAIRFHRTGGPEVLQMEDLPKPQVRAGEVLVHIEAAGVNYADTVRRRGIYYPRPTPLPHIAGAEFVGVVEAAGADDDAELVGTRVIGAGDGGGYAEYIAVPAPAVFPFPHGIEPAPATALYIQGLTAALILKKSAWLKDGESVFVEAAAGGVGSLAVQLARLYGAGLVIGGASTEVKRAMACRLGADVAVDYTQKGWSKKLREITGGHGVDIVMEMTGGVVFL